MSFRPMIDLLSKVDTAIFQGDYARARGLCQGGVIILTEIEKSNDARRAVELWAAGVGVPPKGAADERAT